MLEELRITGLGVIESATLELGPGLTVITGETGAGKTMVVTALGLLLGGRADSGAVRSGSRGARVEGSLRVDALPDVAEAVDEAGGEVEGDRVLLARNVSAEGRSRAFVGGASVPVSQLAAVAEPLVAVHGQADQHRLLQPRAQRDALDAFGGESTAPLLADYRALHAELLRDRAGARRRWWRAPGSGPARPTCCGSAWARSRRSRPRPARTPRSPRRSSGSVTPTRSRTAAESARDGALVRRGRPRRAGRRGGGTHPARRRTRPRPGGRPTLADRVAEITYLLSDVAADVASYAAGLDTDPARLAAVSERRAALTALTRKYGETAAEVLAWARDVGRPPGRARRHRRPDHPAPRAARRPARPPRPAAAGAVRGPHLHGRSALHRAHRRARPARDAARRARGGRARRPRPTTGSRSAAGPCGSGRPASTRSSSCWPPTPGSEPRPLHKGASGGELSRVMLALEVALAGTSPVPTFVFDEVDSGVGGKAAVEVGRRLADAGRSRRRSSSSPTCPRSRRTPTATSSSRRPATAR